MKAQGVLCLHRNHSGQPRSAVAINGGKMADSHATAGSTNDAPEAAEAALDGWLPHVRQPSSTFVDLCIDQLSRQLFSLLRSPSGYIFNMEKLVDVFLSFPTSPTLSDNELYKQATSLLNTLNKTPATQLASSVNGTDLLTVLNPAVNSLVYLYVLYVLRVCLREMEILKRLCRVARMDLGGRNALDATWNNVVLFLETFDPRQIRHAHDIFRRLFEAFNAHAVDSQKVGFLKVI